MDERDTGRIRVLPFVGRISCDPQTGSCEWMIHSFFDFPQSEKCLIMSPTFSFLDEMWHFAVSPSGEGSETFFCVQNSSYPCPPSLKVSCKLGIRGEGGVELMSHSEEMEFTRENRMVRSSGAPPLFRRDRRLYAPCSQLTIFCHFRDAGRTSETSQGHPVASEDDYFDHLFRVWNAEQFKPCLQKLGQDMRNLFLGERNTDMTLNVRGRPFRVHRAVLVARSPVFAAMIEHDTAEKRSGNVEIEDSDQEAFGVFLLHLYSGTMEDLSESNALHLYKVADKYAVEDLKAEYLRFIRSSLSVDTFFPVVRLALQHGEAGLLRDVSHFFAKNLQTITISSEWQTFLLENPVAANELFLNVLKRHGVVE